MSKRIRIRKHASRRFTTGLLPPGKSERRKIELLGGAAVAVFLVLSLGVFGVSSLQRYALRSPNVAAVVSAVLVDLANGDRAQSGLATLTVDPLLVEAAQAKANDMASKGYFAHVSPAGVDPWFWFKQAGYSFNYAGENLAVDFSDSGDVNTAWMNSPTHRENILDPHFTEIGIATAQGMYEGHPTTFVVQEFGAPAPVAHQEPVAAATIPENPTQPALATTQVRAPAAPSAQPAVLGTSASTPVPSVATTSPVLAASLAQRSDENGVPLWGYLIAFPRAAAHGAYYFLAFLIICALLVDTGFELRAHHRKRAMRAVFALAVVCMCFVLADYLFFAQPVLASIAATL